MHDFVKAMGVSACLSLAVGGTVSAQSDQDVSAENTAPVLMAQVSPEKKPSLRERLRRPRQTATAVDSAIKVQADENLINFERILSECKSSGAKDIGTCVEGKLGVKGVSPTKSSRAASTAYFSQMLQNTPTSSNSCSNGEFSQNMSGWTGFSMKRNPGGGLPLHAHVIPRSPFVSSTCSQASNATCLNIETGGTDPMVSSINKTFSGNSLVMGGYSSVGYGAESVAKKFTVTPQDADYEFKYAFSMQASHDAHDSSFFSAIAIDSQGNIVDSFSDSADASNPFIQRTGNQYYRDWHCEQLDLSSKVGEEVLVFFMNSDCGRGGHSGHTYLDDVCVSCENDAEGSITIDAGTDDCLDEGETQTIQGTFNIPNGATNASVDLKLYQGGVQVGSLPGATISGSTYSLGVTRSDFPNTNGFDIVAELSFGLQNLNGNVQTVTKTSSGSSGFTPGQDNDIRLDCTSSGGGGVGTGVLTGTLVGDVLIDSAVYADPSATLNPTLSTCCPPLDDDGILPLFAPQFQGSATGPYRLKYRTGSSEVAALNSKMQAYVNYLNSLDSSITSINLNVRIHDRGPIGGPAPAGLGPQPSPEEFLTWTAGGNGTPSNGGGNFWNPHALQPNTEYRIHVGIYLNDDKKFFSDDCAVHSADFHWQVSGMRPAPGGGGTVDGDFRVKQNGRFKSLSKKSYKLDAAQARKLQQPKRRR